MEKFFGQITVAARISIFFATSLLSQLLSFFRTLFGVLFDKMMFLPTSVAALSIILIKDGLRITSEFDRMKALAHEVCLAFEMAKSSITLSCAFES